MVRQNRRGFLKKYNLIPKKQNSTFFKYLLLFQVLANFSVTRFLFHFWKMYPPVLPDDATYRGSYVFKVPSEIYLYVYRYGFRYHIRLYEKRKWSIYIKLIRKFWVDRQKLNLSPLTEGSFLSWTVGVKETIWLFYELPNT